MIATRPKRRVENSELSTLERALDDLDEIAPAIGRPVPVPALGLPK